MAPVSFDGDGRFGGVGDLVRRNFFARLQVCGCAVGFVSNSSALLAEILFCLTDIIVCVSFGTGFVSSGGVSARKSFVEAWVRVLGKRQFLAVGCLQSVLAFKQLPDID